MENRSKRTGWKIRALVRTSRSAGYSIFPEYHTAYINPMPDDNTTRSACINQPEVSRRSSIFRPCNRETRSLFLLFPSRRSCLREITAPGECIYGLRRRFKIKTFSPVENTSDYYPRGCARYFNIFVCFVNDSFSDKSSVKRLTK